MNSTATAPRPDRRTARPLRPVEVAPRPRLRVVEPPTRRRIRPAFIVGLAVFVVFGALLAAAVVHSMLVSGQAHLDDVSSSTRIEREELEREQVRLASLQSPERITREAERLGMVPGSGDNWIQGDPGAASTTPTEADAGAVPERRSSGSRRGDGGSTSTDDRGEVAATDAQVTR